MTQIISHHNQIISEVHIIQSYQKVQIRRFKIRKFRQQRFITEKVQKIKWGFIAMASGTLNKMRDQKKGSHEKPLLKRSEYLYLNQMTEQTLEKYPTGIETPPSSQNLDGLEVENYSIFHFKSDYSFLGYLYIFRIFPYLAGFYSQKVSLFRKVSNFQKFP